MFRQSVRLARERLRMRASSVSRTPLPTHHRGCHLLWREEAEGASPSHATSCSRPRSVGLAGSPGARAVSACGHGSAQPQVPATS